MGSHDDLRDRRVVLVHERFTEYAGSERVVEQFHQVWPSAPILTAVVDPTTLPASLADADIRPSRLQRHFRPGAGYSRLLPLLPWAFRHLHIPDCDLIVTSHHAFANRIRAGQTPVVSYTHTPARWIWEPSMLAGESGGRVGEVLLRGFAATQRRPDRTAAGRLVGIVANSSHVQARIRRWWERSSTVVAPPVSTDQFEPDPFVAREDFFLLAGRLVPYKKPDVAVAAAERAGVRLVVAGEGRARGAAEAVAGAHTTFLGSVSDGELRDLYRRCRALVMPGEEDFGIVPVEAQACGTPVVAPAVGGVLDSVLDGVTGVLYRAKADPVRDLAAVLAGFNPSAFDSSVIRDHAESFSPAHFRRRFLAATSDLLARS